MSDKAVVNLKLLYDDVKIPEYKTTGSSGMDVYAYFTEEFIKEFKRLYGKVSEDCSMIFIPQHETVMIPTGIKMGIPENYEIQVRSRSGLASQGLIVANATGTIDSDYTGEIKIILLNTTNNTIGVSHGDRIAQLILAPVSKVEYFNIVSDLDCTVRGEGGFGSTGKN